MLELLSCLHHLLLLGHYSAHEAGIDRVSIAVGAALTWSLITETRLPHTARLQPCPSGVRLGDHSQHRLEASPPEASNMECRG